MKNVDTVVFNVPFCFALGYELKFEEGSSNIKVEVEKSKGLSDADDITLIATIEDKEIKHKVIIPNYKTITPSPFDAMVFLLYQYM